MSVLNRYYIEKVSEIDPDPNSGMVKITFAVEGKSGGDVVQVIAHAGKLNEMFREIGEVMQSKFGGSAPRQGGGRGAGPGGPGGRGGGGRGGPGGPGGGRGGPGGGPPQFKDLTE